MISCEKECPDMINYDYFCPANNETVSVAHGIREQILTWGELCEKAGHLPGTTPAETPVERLISGGMLAMAAGGRSSSTPLPVMNSCCGHPSGCSRHG